MLKILINVAHGWIPVDVFDNAYAYEFIHNCNCNGCCKYTHSAAAASALGQKRCGPGTAKLGFGDLKQITCTGYRSRDRVLSSTGNYWQMYIRISKPEMLNRMPTGACSRAKETQSTKDSARESLYRTAILAGWVARTVCSATESRFGKRSQADRKCDGSRVKYLDSSFVLIAFGTRV